MKSLQFITYFHARKMILNFFPHNLKNLSFYSSIPKKLGGKITHDLGTNQKRFTNVLCMAKDYVILIIQFVAHLPPVLTLWLQPQQQIFRAYQIDPRPPAAPADLVAPQHGEVPPPPGMGSTALRSAVGTYYIYQYYYYIYQNCSRVLPGPVCCK